MDSPLPYGQAPPQPPSSEEAAAAAAAAAGVADEAEAEDWYVHAHGGESGGGGGGATQGPLSREEAARAVEEMGSGGGVGGLGVMVWHPTATKAWAPWAEVRDAL